MIVVADTPYRGFSPSQSRILDRMLSAAGIARSDVQLITPGEWHPLKAMEHRCVVLAGEQAAQHVLGFSAPPDSWHGSVFPYKPQPPRDYNAYRSWCVKPAKYVVVHGIDKLHMMWEWHPLAQRDWQKAGQVERGEYVQYDPNAREWVFDSAKRLPELASESVLAFDTELTPSWMFGAANSRQVHVLEWNRDCAKNLSVMQSGMHLKVAHNLQHDLAMCELRFGLKVKPPYFDTYGGAHILNTALERTLSPGIASRFTNWPYHKWLANVDMQRYNGMDNIVCFDAYAEIYKQLTKRGLLNVAAHDHELLTELYEMQMRGFRVDSKARSEFEDNARDELIIAEDKLQVLAAPIIQAKIHKFTKPALFQETRKCKCCGGGKTQAAHCAKCGGLPKKPKNKSDYPLTFAPGVERTLKSLQNALPQCRTCLGAGKSTTWTEFNPGSSDQVGDVVYRGLGIAPRRYKGKETTSAAALAKIADKHPLIGELVATSKLRAELATVERMAPGTDGKLHCVFDPWGTESGRVAGKEGLLQPGTNPMNIPKKARRFVVPDAGKVFMYPDMAQIEARVVAVLSRKWDTKLEAAFSIPINWPGHEKHGKIDSHTYVQQMVSKWVEITRDQAKRLTYAVMYGVSPKQLAVELTNEAQRRGGTGFVNEQQAEAMIRAFFLAFPGVQMWHEAVEQELMQSRTIVSLTGRERHWPGRIVDRKTKGVMREVLKQAWSFVPQDTGAWILAEGIKSLSQHPRTKYLGIELLVHVHDAVLMQVPIENLSMATELAKSCLSQTKFGMNFPCDMKVGATWYEAS